MICRNCGTEIADKAIVCYRCGTATTDPIRKPVEIRGRRGWLVPLVIAILAALMALYFGYESHVFGLDLILSPVSYSVYSVYSVAVAVTEHSVCSVAVVHTPWLPPF